MTFDDETRALLDGRNFATVATLNADGDPHTSVVWIMSQKYLGEDPPAEPDTVRRLIVRVTPRKVTGFSV